MSDEREDTQRPDTPTRRTYSDMSARAIAHRRMGNQTQWVEQQLRVARERGEFDNLQGSGKPLDLGDAADPNWWVKRLADREDLSGALPPALQLKREAQRLPDQLDRENSEREVRRVVSDFNDRVIEARRQLMGGPPVVTALRDVDAEVDGWRERRRQRQRAQAEAAVESGADEPSPRTAERRGWFSRLFGRR